MLNEAARSPDSPSSDRHAQGANASIHAVTAITVALAVITSANQLNLSHPVAFYAIAFAYLLTGTLGLATSERLATRWATSLYFVLMAALLLVLLELSGGNAWVAALPLLSHLTMVVPLRGAMVAALVFTLYAGLRHAPPSEDPLQNLLGIGTASAFVVVFSTAARRELEWRLRAEALADELRAANAQLSSYAEQVAVSSRLEERQRLAQEVHDGLGHYLTAIHVQLEATRLRLAPDSPALAGLLSAQGLARQGLSDVRQAVTLMRDDAEKGRLPERSLPEQLEELAVSDGSALAIEVVIDGDARHVDASAHHALVRVAQEALTNVRRHSDAKRALVRLCFEVDQVRLRVQDDGRGAGELRPGFGLIGIRERITQLQGHCYYGPMQRSQSDGAEQSGFCLEVSVPG